MCSECTSHDKSDGVAESNADNRAIVPAQCKSDVRANGLSDRVAIFVSLGNAKHESDMDSDIVAI